MPDAAAQYLDPHLLATVGSIELRARMIVEGLMTGQHRSPYQGISVEFAQHRPYVPGDDTRFLDWKVYGKTDKLYLKQYQKETNLDMLLLVDASGSMNYGSVRPSTSDQPALAANQNARPGNWKKYDHAATLAAAMSHLALQQQDRVGLMVFDHQVRSATRLSNNQGHWRSIIETLSSIQFPDTAKQTEAKPSDTDGRPEDDPGTDFASLFDRVIARLTQRSLIVLVSDLFDDPAALERGLARLQHRRHDTIILQVMDPAELEFPFRTPSEFVGLEAEGRLPLDPAALRKHYLDVLQDHQHQIQEIARKFRFDHLLLNTGESLGPTLSHFLAHRAAAIARS